MPPLPDFDKYFGQDRSHCSGGQRFFDIKPEGHVYRCAHTNHDSIGNILDDRFRMDILTNLLRPLPCKKPTCVAACGGLFTEQYLPGGLVHHGVDPTWKGLIGKNYAEVNWSITHVCNYNCTYCSAGEWMASAANAKMQPMSRDQIQEVSRWFTSNFDLGSVTLVGGEPTVHPGWADCAEIFIDHGWTFDLISNLSLGQKIIDVLKKIPIGKRGRFRLIYSAHVHQKKFDLDRDVKTLKALRELNPNMDICVTYVMTPENIVALHPDQLKEAISPLGNIVFNLADEILSKVERLAGNK